jgi:hypothetical protein
VHLRVKDGVADVRVDGAGASTVDIRPQELRVALAGEGIALGSFESGQQPSHRNDADAPFDERGAPQPPPAPTSAPAPAHPALPRGRGVHITA